MRSISVVAILLASAFPRCGVGAQPARMGRLPLMEPLRSATIRCRTDLPLTAELRRQGMTSILEATDTVTGRSMSLLLSSGGHTKMLMSMMSDSIGARHEIEIVTVFFLPDGRVLRGSRMAMTSGVPARLSEDRRAGLLPADTAGAVALARNIRQRCAP